MKRTREQAKDGRSSGFMATLRERARPFPEWADISDFFNGDLNIGPYRTYAKKYGFLLRRKDSRVYACIAPFAVSTAAPTATKENT